MKTLFTLIVAICLGCVTSSFGQVTASFSYPSGCLQTATVQFTNTSTTSTGSLTYSWNFGDGYTSSSANPTHSYPSEGMYNVMLIATNSMGARDTATHMVEVKVMPLLAYTPVGNVCFGSSPVSIANAVVTNGTSGSGIYAGPGVSSFGMFDPAVAGVGPHVVRYVFTTIQGCTDSIMQVISVIPPAQRTLDTGLCSVAFPLYYHGHTYYSPGTYVDTLAGSAGCDTVLTVHLVVKNPSYAYANVSVCSNYLPYSWNGNLYYSAGNYIDTLVNAAGCDSFVMLQLTVKPVTTSTTNTTICSWNLPYVWNGQSYNAPGTYSMTFVNSVGCDSVATLNLSILPAPSASFSFNFIDSFCSSRTVAFSAIPNSSASYYWSFGDGATSSAVNPIHVYTAPGAYVVNLGVYNSCGADTLVKAVIIAPENHTIWPALPNTLLANRQCDADSGWTNYYFDNNTPADITDDTLLLSLKLNGQYIGKIGDGIFQVKVVATPAAGSNTGILLTNPLITNPSGFWVMNRYWNVNPAFQPTSPVGVRFYFNTQDVNDVNGSFPAHNLSVTDLIFYKTTGGNPDPTTNLAGATAIATIVNGSVADTGHWVYSALSTNTHAAAFEVSHFSGGGGGATGNGQVLPQIITAFDAVKKGQSNLITWTTCAQIKGFEIQRSNTASDFIPVGYVPAQTGLCKQYTFPDNSPVASRNYYRLKLLDNDGRFTYSSIKSVTNNGSVNVVVFPNPTKDVLSLQMTSDARKNIQLQVMSMEGKVLHSVNTVAAQGTSVKALNVASLQAGSYFVKLTSSGESVVVKFQKQ